MQISIAKKTAGAQDEHRLHSAEKSVLKFEHGLFFIWFHLF